MKLAPLALVVAVAKNGVIGRDGGLPWRFPEDLKFFKRITVGHAVIMGRNTYESIGKPLPDRRNIVITRTAGYSAPGCEAVSSLEDALRLARANDSEPRIIGGASLYEAAMPLVTTMYYTEIDEEPAGNVFFPKFDRSEFIETQRRAGEDPRLAFVTLTRK
ncbi:MAG: dihydrofolate reductase [Sandaracinaceae bacterium]|nr:dihydrofolate reductase [Sandaracinaceae bacterium]